MSKYIDAEWLKGEIRKAFPSFYMRVEINTLVNLAPSIDLVRCKECKHCVPYSTCDGDYQMCMRWEDYSCDVTLNDFCSWGERRDDE